MRDVSKPYNCMASTVSCCLSSACSFMLLLVVAWLAVGLMMLMWYHTVVFARVMVRTETIHIKYSYRIPT